MKESACRQLHLTSDIASWLVEFLIENVKTHSGISGWVVNDKFQPNLAQDTMRVKDVKACWLCKLVQSARLVNRARLADKARLAAKLHGWVRIVRRVFFELSRNKKEKKRKEKKMLISAGRGCRYWFSFSFVLP